MFFKPLALIHRSDDWQRLLKKQIAIFLQPQNERVAKLKEKINRK